MEVVVLEAAHRLHFDCGIELERIDEANVLPLVLLGGTGLVHKASQRYSDIRHVQGFSRVTLVSGIYSNGMAPRGRIRFPFLDHQYPMRSIYAGG